MPICCLIQYNFPALSKHSETLAGHLLVEMTMPTFQISAGHLLVEMTLPTFQISLYFWK
jgi:hypothetical protein